MNFEVVKTNIVNVAASAIVLPANEQLKEGSGTSHAIFEAAGRKELTKACEKIGRCDVGSAIPTLAYNLKSRYIIHAVVPRWIDGESGEYDLLSSAYISALNAADILGCESVAFPVLASGHNGFDKELAVNIAKESIDRFSPINLKKVILVIYGDNMKELMVSLGYQVTVIPDKIYADERKIDQKANLDKILADGKIFAQKALEEQMPKVIEWLKDEKNREKVIKGGVEIAKFVIAKGKKLPKK